MKSKFSLAALLLTPFMIAAQVSSGFKVPSFRLIQTDTFKFNNFVDCNMAAAWVGDTFRIFPGKYGEDPVWGDARDLKFSSGKNADEAFSNPAAAYIAPSMPSNGPGLHGAVWFETVYQDVADKSGRTLYAVYHNENYPETLPYNPTTGEGYIDKDWPLGLTERITPACCVPDWHYEIGEWWLELGKQRTFSGGQTAPYDPETAQHLQNVRRRCRRPVCRGGG
jgi:hypothetical protein